MTSDNNVANSPKNIYCIGETLVPTFMAFKDSIITMKSKYETYIGLKNDDKYDPTTNPDTEPDTNPTATLYGKLNYILGELYKQEDEVNEGEQQQVEPEAV